MTSIFFFFVLGISGPLRAQSIAAPYNLQGESIAETPPSPGVDIKLTWTNGSIYDGIMVYRNGTALVITPIAPATTTYTDTGTVVIGTEYVYRVCGYLDVNRDGIPDASEERCSEKTVTARNVDYDVIVARVYKNLKLLPINEWYVAFAPNPVGSPEHITVDGYDAIRDGSSIYIGYAVCSQQVNCIGGRIYSNVLLLSVNPNAKESTSKIFQQLLGSLQLNNSLVQRHDGSQSVSCSRDYSLNCDREYDELCASKNAGLCMSAKAELRRDFKRVTDLHKIADIVYRYGKAHSYCDDGSQSKSCVSDSDCPFTSSGNVKTRVRCVSTYPLMSSGTYIAGMSTSAWPSWDMTLGKELASSLPKDPINKFGANFYYTQPSSCNEFGAGYDPGTCWDERQRNFKCHRGSEVYIYKNKNATNFKVLGQVEAYNWSSQWYGIDSNVIIDMDNDAMNQGERVCKDAAAINAACGNGLIEKYCNGDHSRSCRNNSDCATLTPATCGGEVCDGGMTDYCQMKLGPGRYNNEFKVPCVADCSRWEDPYPNPANARIACGGACGDGTIDATEQCDTKAAFPAGWDCTVGGSPYCSATCRIACNAGVPYRGLCGDGTVQLPEVCDDGPANDTLNHCNAVCSGYGNYCGDGILSSVEECDLVLGLTGYHCPAYSSLYCDTSCQRACTDIDIDANQIRQSVPVYEHYFLQGDVEDNDYTLNRTSEDNYTQRGIKWYGYLPTNPLGTANIYRFVYNGLGPTRDHYLTRNPADNRDIDGDNIPDYQSQGVVFRAFAADMNDKTIVPIYEFRSRKFTGSVDYYYSRSGIPRKDSTGRAYESLGIAFYALIGPFNEEEICGNGIIEGAESCEPSTFQTPTPQNSSISQQYLCGAFGSPEQCQTYGGYCGNGDPTPALAPQGTRDVPYEECDRGTSNGSFCDNGLNDCQYCTTGCTIATLAANFCGDGNVAGTEVCDEALLNGTPNHCNATCSGVTEADCGNGVHESGEMCDDGVKNNTWADHSCSADSTKPCASDPECIGFGTCTGPAAPYCNSSCTGRTQASCGDARVQSYCSATRDNCSSGCPGVGNFCFAETCDDGLANGTVVGGCNATCDGIMPAICGDMAVGTGEDCDPPRLLSTDACTDSNGDAGLIRHECSKSCHFDQTQCVAFGLKVWSDAVDLAYINGERSQPAFGDKGVVIGDANTRSIRHIIKDVNYLYIAGDTDDTTWHVEKRLLATGEPDPLWNPGPPLANATALRLLLTGGYLYVVGTQDIGTDCGNTGNWRIEKRRSDTGALCTGVICGGVAFGTNGVITVSAEANYISDIIAVGSDMYIAGNNYFCPSPTYPAGSNGWRVEKRLLTTGAPVAAFSGGVLSGAADMMLTEATYPSELKSITWDQTNSMLVLAGTQTQVNGVRGDWRVEGRKLDTGHLCDGTSPYGQCNGGEFGIDGVRVIPEGDRLGQGVWGALDHKLYLTGNNDAGRMYIVHNVTNDSSNTPFARMGYTIAPRDPNTPFIGIDYYVAGDTTADDWLMKSYRVGNDVEWTIWGDTPDPLSPAIGGYIRSLPGKTAYSVVFDDQFPYADRKYFYLAGVNDNNDWRIERRYMDVGEMAYGQATGTHLAVAQATGLGCSEDPYPYTVKMPTGYQSKQGVRVNYSLPESPPGANLCTSGFGLGGVISGDALTSYGADFVSDFGFLYIAIVDDANDWRLEKRNKTTGAITYSQVSPQGKTVETIALDATAVYMGGQDDAGVWRIEKRDKITGALVPAFGTNGFTGGSGIGTTIKRIAVLGDYVYVLGTSNVNSMVIRKLRALTGALCTAAENCDGGEFGTAGIVSEPAANSAGDMAADGQFIYVIGGTASSDWLIQKRAASDGSLAYSTVNTRGEKPYGIALDVSRQLMYLTGTCVFNYNPQNVQTCSEQRRMSNGNLCTAAENCNGDNSVFTCGVTVCGEGRSITSSGDGVTRRSALDLIRNHLYTSNSMRNANPVWLADCRSKVGSGCGCAHGQETAARQIWSILVDQEAVYELGQNTSNNMRLEKRNFFASGVTNMCELMSGGSTIKVPFQEWSQTTAIRPVDVSGNNISALWERTGKNVVAIKAWPESIVAYRGLHAAYASPNLNELFYTTGGNASAWLCSTQFTNDWNKIDCPECDAAHGWTRPTTYTGSASSADARCSYGYTNIIGGGAEWIWGSSCTTDPPTLYCRLEFTI